MSDVDLSALTDEALWCRSEGHKFEWQHDEITRQGDRLLQATRIMQCDRCGALADRVINLRTFEKGRRKIPTYPEGYLLPRGSGRVAPEEVTMELFARLGVA